jgi:hypothetical protein
MSWRELGRENIGKFDLKFRSTRRCLVAFTEVRC